MGITLEFFKNYSISFLASSAPFTIDLILSKETSLVLVRRPQSGLTYTFVGSPSAFAAYNILSLMTRWGLR